MSEPLFFPGWEMRCSGAEAYERYIVPAWMGEWARALVEAGQVGPGNRVLDVACGTGVVARMAASRVGATGLIVGTDAEAGMIAQARELVSAQPGQSLDWRQADAACLPFAPASFDVALCQQGLQFFPQRVAALREMYRVLATGGRLALSVWRALDRFPLFTILAGVLGDLFGAQAAAIFQASSALADREALRALAIEAGFRNIRIRLEVRVARYPSLAEFLPGYLSVFPVATAIRSLPEAKRQDLFRRLAALLDDFTDDDGLAAPMESHVLTAVK